MNPTNWAGNYTYTAARWHFPETVQQVQELVARGRKVKVVGSRHSFNDIADTSGDILCLERFNRVAEVNRVNNTVLVQAGVRYGELCRQLGREGYALRNLASLPHISVAGACATATHGSGDRNGNLATAVASMVVVAADGQVLVFSREHHGEVFQGAVVGLGGLGVVTMLALDVVPAYEMRQDVYENLPLARLEEHFEDLFSSAYSVSLFTDWSSASFNQVWLKRHVTGGAPAEVPAELFGARLATSHRHPTGVLSAESCTEQMGIPGAWHERLPHFRMDYTPSSGEELQSEYFVPRQHALTAFRTLDRLREHIVPHLQISEVRTIAADELWMSPCYKQACVAIHFTWKKDWPAVRKLLPLIEEQLAPLGARPHWGKLFTLPPEQVRALYEKLPDFQRLLQRFDPEGKFRNAFLDRYIFGEPS